MYQGIKGEKNQRFSKCIFVRIYMSSNYTLSWLCIYNASAAWLHYTWNSRLHSSKRSDKYSKTNTNQFIYCSFYWMTLKHESMTFIWKQSPTKGCFRKLWIFYVFHVFRCNLMLKYPPFLSNYSFSNIVVKFECKMFITHGVLAMCFLHVW